MSSGTANLSDFTEEELRAYFGPNADYYVAACRTLNQSAGRTRFNWAAFFLASCWFLYRKLYWAAAIYFILAAPLQLMLVIVSSGHTPLRPLRAWVLGLPVAFLAGFLAGKYGNRWYLGKARQEIHQVRLSELIQEARLGALRKRGGTNTAAPIVAIVAVVGVGVILALLARGDWTDYTAIDQSQSSFRTTEVGFEYHNPKYGVTVRLPGAWHTVETKPPHFCDLENNAGMIASFSAYHYFLNLEEYASNFKQNMLADGRYKSEGESDIEVSGTHGKQLGFRNVNTGDLVVVLTLKKRVTVYMLTVIFLHPEVGEVNAGDKSQREKVLAELPQAVQVI